MGVFFADIEGAHVHENVELYERQHGTSYDAKREERGGKS